MANGLLCKHGHDITGSDALDAYKRCRECARITARKYRQSQKGRDYYSKYDRKENVRRYHQSEGGKANKRLWRQTKKGKRVIAQCKAAHYRRILVNETPPELADARVALCDLRGELQKKERQYGNR